MPVHDIVVVGFSAGGIEPLLRLVGALPADFPGAVCVVHHFPPQSVSALPNILQRSTALRAAQAVDGEPIVPGHIYVARPDQHLMLTGGRIRCTNGPREQGHRPAIDPLFRSAARTFGPRVAGVILSGTLDDGTVGLIEIKARGGVALVQQPEEAAYSGMAMSALRNVSVDHVGPVRESRGHPRPAGSRGRPRAGTASARAAWGSRRRQRGPRSRAGRHGRPPEHVGARPTVPDGLPRMRRRALHIRKWSRRAEDMWGLRQDEALHKNFLNLDIGLPVDRLRAPIRACLACESEFLGVTLDATNRRGRPVQVRVTCTPLATGAADEARGVILLMEEADARA